jgi:hypothetical protein
MADCERVELFFKGIVGWLGHREAPVGPVNVLSIWAAFAIAIPFLPTR